jgi:hypothetical protein
MQTVVSINQREFIGLLKYVLETRPASSASSLGLVMDFAKFSARLGVKDVFPSETLYTVKLIDEGLELQYCQLKRENVTTEMFWGLHKTEASLVLRAADVDTILANTTQWADVAVEISRTVHGSRLGNAMFGFAATLVASETFSATVDELLGMLPVNVTTNVIAEITEKALTEAGKLLCADLVASKRNITVMYRGIKLTLAVTDVSAEIELRIAAWLKSRAVHAELLEPLL